eukprot:TRINITY_DN752_c0_g1_i1.p1 TRINITY_DN752_c0_g1~~TRINITY_DN752_c0_g1_i1.p1  ORF type:complete len:193 (-),score=24.83 TRINITY_DN752_c0_g1_i1:183-761(-)
MNIFTRIINKYTYSLSKYPLRTQIITSGGLWFLGDLISQKLESRGKENTDIDWTRLIVSVTYGTILAGPIFHLWYKFLDAKTIHILAKSRAKYIFSKIALDQCVFEFPFLFLFFASTTYLEDFLKKKPEPTKHLKEKLKNEYFPTYFMDCKVWIPIQILNFAFVPVKFQALFVNAVCVGWNAFLSYVSHRNQ